MYRKEILDKYGFNNDVPASEDYDAIVKVASESKIKNLKDVLSHYRLHKQNISQSDKLINNNNRKIISYQLSQLGIEVNDFF